MSLTHRQRIEHAIAFKEVDRVPYSVWMHFPNRDRHPRRLAEMCLSFQKEFDLDFIKFMPYGLYSAVDFGIDLTVFAGFGRAPVLHRPLVEKPDDWDRVNRVDGTRGEFSIVLESQKILLDSLSGEVPVLQTLFSPLTVAAKLSSTRTVVDSIAKSPDKVHRALQIITDASIEFATAAVAAGADGLYFASQMSSRDFVDGGTHDEFIRKYDLKIIEAVRAATWFNVLHLHGRNVHLDRVEDYPIQVLNWHDRDEGPGLGDVRPVSGKAFLGGLSTGRAFTEKSEAWIRADVRDAVESCGRRGILLGPGCALEPDTPPRLIHAVRDAARTL